MVFGGLLGEGQVWPSTQPWPPPSWLFLTLESILLSIICSSHLKQGRWLYIAGTLIARTSPPDSEGYSSHVCTRIPGKSLISEQPGMKTGSLKMQFNSWTERINLSGKVGKNAPPPIIITSEVPSREALSPTTGVLWKMRDLLKKKRHVIMSVKILRNPGHGSLTCFSQTGFNEINEIIHLSSLTEPDLVTWVFNPEDCHEIRLLAFIKALCNTETKALMRLEYTERNCQWGWFMTRSLDSSSVSDPAAASGSTLGSTLVLNLLLDVSWSLS